MEASQANPGPYEHSWHVCDAPKPWGFNWPSPASKCSDDMFLLGCSEHRYEVERITDERIGRLPRTAHPNGRRRGELSAPLAALRTPRPPRILEEGERGRGADCWSRA